MSGSRTKDNPSQDLQKEATKEAAPKNALEDGKEEEMKRNSEEILGEENYEEEETNDGPEESTENTQEPVPANDQSDYQSEYQCTICNKKFSIEQALQSHTNAKHRRTKPKKKNMGPIIPTSSTSQPNTKRTKE